MLRIVGPRVGTQYPEGPIRPIVFNGKFYSGRLNGVHRVADRLIRQADRVLAALPRDTRPDACLYLPPGCDWAPGLTAIRMVTDPRATSQRWEQLILPRLAADAVLVSLANLAPLLHPRQLLMIHDAQFLFSDNSYTTRQQIGYKHLIPLMARRARIVLTVSNFSARMLDLAGVAPLDKTRVVHNGGDHILDVQPDPTVLAAHRLSPGGFVLMFGTAKAYKNVQIVFDAFRDSRLTGQRLVVVGETEAQLRAGGLDPSPGAVFTGPIDDAALRSLYEQASCLVFPSRTEGFGLPPLEAMILECPAVVAPAGAIPEVCHNAAIYAGVDAVDEWVEAIAAIATGGPHRQAMIDAGRRRAAAFTWQRAGEQLVATISELAGEAA